VPAGRRQPIWRYASWAIQPGLRHHAGAPASGIFDVAGVDMNENDAKWMTVKEAADRAKLSEWSIYQGCERGEIRHIRVGGRRAIRLTPEAIDDWLLQHERAPVGAAAGAGHRVPGGAAQPSCANGTRIRTGVGLAGHPGGSNG